MCLQFCGGCVRIPYHTPGEDVVMNVKKALKIALCVVAALVLVVGGYLAYVFLTYYRVPDNQPLEFGQFLFDDLLDPAELRFPVHARFLFRQVPVQRYRLPLPQLVDGHIPHRPGEKRFRFPLAADPIPAPESDESVLQGIFGRIRIR